MVHLRLVHVLRYSKRRWAAVGLAVAVVAVVAAGAVTVT